MTPGEKLEKLVVDRNKVFAEINRYYSNSILQIITEPDIRKHFEDEKMGEFLRKMMKHWYVVGLEDGSKK